MTPHYQGEPKGLSSSEAEKLLQKNGYNEIPEKKAGMIKKVIGKLISPISFMLLAAALLSLSLGKTFDFYFILILLFINVAISLWQENKADNAIEKLNENLSQNVMVLRDGAWKNLDSRNIVNGDIIRLGLGDVIPADGKIIEANYVSINESSLTGESLPKEKRQGDIAYSGSFVATGTVTIRVTATGPNTDFGKTIFSVERIRKKSLLEKDILDISKFLTLLSIIAIIILSTVFFIQKASFIELLTLDLSLLIAGVPISLPTVMTLIIEFGVLALAKKNAIVRRLSALDDLANVNFLLTDKTGTLTKNKITVEGIYAFDGFNNNDVISYAAILASAEDENPIGLAINEKAQSLEAVVPVFIKKDFIPADSNRKRSTVIIEMHNKDLSIAMGAPQIILSHCSLDDATQEKFKREVESLASDGYRTLAVAIAEGHKEENMKIAGILALSDTLRSEAKSVVQFLEENGVGVTVVTGDNRAIAGQIARQLSLDGGRVVTKEELDRTNWEGIKSDFYRNTGAFAEILPEDKLLLVQKAKKMFVVASNGDGINDLPAIKAANVGIAVKNAVTALKATADIVLLSDGISVIKDAILESRRIFERLYSYSVYRISESLRLIVTIVLLGILYGVYPMTSLQILILAFLNDIPIISLGFDRVKIANRPAKIDAKKRFTISSLFGLVGIINSLFLFLIVQNVLRLDWAAIQTIFFLKLTVSGHMLIFVAHTKERWWKFLPSKGVIWATASTQIIATVLALTGLLMPQSLSLMWVIFVWLWAFFWMQVSDLMKGIQRKINKG